MTRLMTIKDCGGLGEELGRGGQAKVFRLGRDHAFVAKIYHSESRPSVSALSEVIDWRTSLSNREGVVIDARTSWPHALLSDDRDEVVGAVLPAIPSEYFAELRIQQKRKVRPRELNYLLAPRKSHDLGIPIPDLDDRLRICREWVRVFDVLDLHGVVFGDISMRNLLWSTDVDCTGYVIDCDTAQTDPPRSPSPWTQDWDDPHLGQLATSQPADFASDRYKLTLVVYRTLVGHHSRRPPSTTSELRSHLAEPVPDALLDLIVAGVGADRRGRPRPSEWLPVMDDWIGPDRTPPRVPDRTHPAPRPASATGTRTRRHVSVGRRLTSPSSGSTASRPTAVPPISTGRGPAGGPVSAARQRRMHRIDELPSAGTSPEPSARQAPESTRNKMLRTWPVGVKILLWLAFITIVAVALSNLS